MALRSILAIVFILSCAYPAQGLVEGVVTGSALFFDLDPEFGEMKHYGQVPGSSRLDTTLVSTGGYKVTLTGTVSKDKARVQFSLKRIDGKTFKTRAYGVAVDTETVPLLKKAGFYREGGTRTAGNRNPPVICVKDGDGNCPLVLGFVDQVEVAEIHHDGSTMKMSRPAAWETITANEIKDGIYVDVSGQYWFDALTDYANYADQYRNFKPRPIPEQAYEPVWCSWYTLTTRVNEKNIWENAVIAKELGFGTILIDGGWDTPGNNCLGPTYGDRVAYFGKFPDMAGLVDRIHNELGMAVELWAAPWFVHKKARASKEIENCRTLVPGNEKAGSMLCPRSAKTGDFLAKNLADLFTYYHIDGMWWDFLDSVPICDCQGDHHDYETYGRGYNAAMTKIIDAIHEIKPDALIEIRLGSSNINNKLFANVLETYDTPLYFQDNRGLLVYVRTLADGCVPKTDPTMWLRSSEEGEKAAPDEEIGRFMSTMVTVGVPAVSQDLRKLSESNKRVVKAYLDFYHAHKKDLIEADFRPVGNGKNYPNYVLEGRNAAYLYSETTTMPKLALERAPKVAYIFNATEKPKIALDIAGLAPGKCAWEAKDHFLQTTASGEVEVTRDGLVWEAPAPPGGMLELKPS